MPELGARLRDYVEAIAPPIGEEEIRRGAAAPVVGLTPPRRRAIPVLGLAALVATLLVTFGLLWDGAQPSRLGDQIWRGIWPQSSREDAEHAQARADAGDDDYTWQAPGDDPLGLVPRRFVREHFGWSDARLIAVGSVPFDGVPPGTDGEDWEVRVLQPYLIRCGSGTNLAYPLDPVGGTCPPTIDETHYEVIRVDLEQLVRRGPTGIWVVTGWADVTGEMEGREVQAVPPDEEDLITLMTGFLEARLAGTGAEGYVGTLTYWNDPVELGLYRSSSGSPWVGYEIRSVEGPEWPNGTYSLTVRLTAADGSAVEEGPYRAGPVDVRLGWFQGNLFEVTESP